MRSTAWVSKQASAFISALSFPLLQSQLSLGSALQIPVCKQPDGMGSDAGKGAVSHYASGTRKPSVCRASGHYCKADSK